MNNILIIANPDQANTLSDIFQQLELPLVVAMHAHGTASKTILDFLGIASRERRVFLTVATFSKTEELIKILKRSLYIDIPGNGVLLTVPVKSIGGNKIVSYLSGKENPKYQPEVTYPYELILALTNEGYTDMVMDAAREGGATGGTVLHGKGTGYAPTDKFFQVSLAREKEVILIVAKATQKAAIMRSILHSAGPASKAGTLVFSMPVGTAAGFNIAE